MPVIYVTPQDMTEIRFAYSPLIEMVTSYKVYSRSNTDARFRPWIEEAREALSHVDLPYMNDLIFGGSYIPDFVTPTPLTTRESIEVVLESVLETPEDIVRSNIKTAIGFSGETAIRQQFLAYPRESLFCLVEELRLYWQRALSRHWSRINAVLEGDILYRARRLALEGTNGLFEDLSPTMTFQPGRIVISKPQQACDPFQDTSLRGNGLQLVPVVFSKSDIMWQIDSDWHPMLIYNARGTGLWWQPAKDSNQALELTLGAGRASVLQALITPLSTGELAQKLQVSSGAISQHLGRLNEAGLVEPHRSGKRVYYQLTQRGEGLLALFS